MPSPVGVDHRSHDTLVIGWLSYYAARTPGCEGGNNGTWLMLEDAPQPDADLRILPEYGGQSRVEGPYCAGAPELAAEVSLSSASYDLGPKMELYRAAGVKEYLALAKVAGRDEPQTSREDSPARVVSTAVPGWREHAAQTTPSGAAQAAWLAPPPPDPEDNLDPDANSVLCMPPLDHISTLYVGLLRGVPNQRHQVTENPTRRPT